jgi:serine-type D-Ala-D-Ala carboxypeptidase/endopeptidase
MIHFPWLSLSFCLGVAMAQTSAPAGDYSGVLGPLHLKLHLKVEAGGHIEGTLDSVDQGSLGLPCANFRLENETFSFDVPLVGGKWHGTLAENGAVLRGTWSQGAETPLLFRRDEPFTAAAKPSRVDGIWLGSVGSGKDKLRVQLQVKSDQAGKQYCSMDSLDQGAMGLPCDNVQFHGDRFSFHVPSVNGSWSGTLAENGNELNGKWSQAGTVTLRLTRQETALAAKAPEPPKYDPALPPVPLRELKSMLDRDLTTALSDGALAPATAGAVVIGVVQHGAREIFVYGPAKTDAIFEIGSISKTFTGLILAQMVAQHKVKLEDPVRELLPAGTVAKPDGAEITLLDLATQHSGLPRLPDNFRPTDPQDPYAAYQAANLYEFIAGHGVKRPSNAVFSYSNLGLGLLGQALANRSGLDYPELLRTEITGPLKMTDTVVNLSPEQEKRFIPGHDAQHRAARPWNLAALAGAGAIRSTAADMLTYLEAQLHPDRVPRTAADSPSATLASALQMSHELHADALPKLKVALAWLYSTETGTFVHDGATGGYSSYAFFNPKEDCAAVVLFNTTIGTGGSFANRLGERIAARLLGKPAISLRD